MALWRAVIDQALQDALATKRIMRDGRPTFASVEGDKARYWFWRADANFAFVCDCADLSGSAVAGITWKRCGAMSGRKEYEQYS